MNYEAMPYAELKEIHEKLGLLLATKREEALEQIKGQIASLGFSAEDLVTKKNGKRAPARLKYRNPENPAETWTGKGRKPTWMQAMLDGGKAKEDFLID